MTLAAYNAKQMTSVFTDTDLSLPLKAALSPHCLLSALYPLCLSAPLFSGIL